MKEIADGIFYRLNCMGFKEGDLIPWQALKTATEWLEFVQFERLIEYYELKRNSDKQSEKA